MSSIAECTSTTGFLLLSLILGVLGIAFVYTIIGAFVGIALIIASWILFFISLIMLIKMIAVNGITKQSGWCKFNIAFCVVLLILLIVFAAIGGNEHAIQTAPANPAPSNESTTEPQSN